MPAQAPALVVRFHQMPSTSGTNSPAAASEKAQATMATMTAGWNEAKYAPPTATRTSSTRATVRRRVVDALGSIIW